VDLALFLDDDEINLPARVVAQRGAQLRMSFRDLDLRHEEGLVRCIYGRADAWHAWDREVPADKPLTSYARIVRFAFSGLRNLVFGRGGRA
jgi:hypothetical protein